MSDDEDLDLAELEEQLGEDDDDVFGLIDHCMDAGEFIQKIKVDPLVAVMPGVEFTDNACKEIANAMAKASKLEGISLDNAVISPNGLLVVLDAIRKHRNLKHLGLSGLPLGQDQVVSSIAEFLQNNQILISMRLEDINFSPTGLKLLLQALEKNRSLHHFHITTMDHAYNDKVEKLLERNKSGVSAIQPNSSSRALMGAGPATGGKVITLWIKGQVHIGEAPPSNEPGWMRFTFDGDTQFGGGNVVATKAATPAQTTSPSASAPVTATQVPVSAATATSAGKTSAAAAKAPLTQKESTGAPKAATPAAATKPQPKILFRAKALYDYPAEDPDEVPFKAGDMIDITKVVDEDWYIGRVERTGKSGQVPANHLQNLK